MKFYDWKKYRRRARKIGDQWRPGSVTIALYDDTTPGRYRYIYAPENHEELASRPGTEIGEEPISILPEHGIKMLLKSKGFDLGQEWGTFFDVIYNFGGINLNLKTGGYKGFEPLTKNPTGGIDWDTHETEVVPPTFIR